MAAIGGAYPRPGGRAGPLPYARTMEPDVHATIDEELRRTRQRYTAGRRELVSLLLAAGRPLTIAELLADEAPQSQSSLYRNLAVLERCGVIRRLTAPDDVARFELAEDLSHHHHHLACASCGRLDDVVLPPELERSLAAVAERAGRANGFTVSAHRVELVGTCADCR